MVVRHLVALFLQSLGRDTDYSTTADEADVQAALLAITGQRTVPNIFINHKHIGGNSDLKALANSGKLKALLEEAGAKA
jgi:glutaredoxin 3